MSNPDTPALRYYRKIFKITAEDSPNVRYARAQIARGLEPTGEMIVPGVMPWGEYQKRRATWDKISQCIGLDAEFYEGAEILLYPPEWLNRSDAMARQLFSSGVQRKAVAIGIDPAEGGDKTSMSAIDQLGLIERVTKKTPNTAVIVGEAVAFMRKHGVPAERVGFDRGGGGKQHADTMRAMGREFLGIRTVAFGEAINPVPKRGMTILEDKIEQREEKYTYVNRRAQMYGELRLLLDPADYTLQSDYYSHHVWDSVNKQLGGKSVTPGKLSPTQQAVVNKGFAIPLFMYPELRQQMAPIPLTYDPEGRLKLLPKNKRSKDSEEKTLTELIGHSPDELDSLVIAIHMMLHKTRQVVAGGIR